MSSNRGYIRIDTNDATCVSDVCKTINNIIAPRLVNLCELIPKRAWGVSIAISIPKDAESIMLGIMKDLKRIKYTEMACVQINFSQTDMSFTNTVNNNNENSN